MLTGNGYLQELLKPSYWPLGTKSKGQMEASEFKIQLPIPQELQKCVPPSKTWGMQVSLQERSQKMIMDYENHYQVVTIILVICFRCGLFSRTSQCHSWNLRFNF